MADISRYFRLGLPEGDDSVAASAGLTQLNDFYDDIDLILTDMSAVPVPDHFLGIWVGSSSQTLSNTTTPVNPTVSYTQLYNSGDTPAPTVNLTNGGITFATAGVYRITHSLNFTLSTAIAEGYIKTGIKTSATAALMTEFCTIKPMETYAGIQDIHNSHLVSVVAADSTDFELVIGSIYYLTAVQQNSSATTVSMGGSSSWFSIEYVRP